MSAMRKFERLTAIAAPFPEGDIDTDVIFPARFLLITEKEGLGRHLFHERRAGRPDGAPAFVLDTPPYDAARILVAGPNFGSGSSREQAVWALADFGIACVIAPSFGEIFEANCLRNGILPVVLEEAAHQRVLAVAERGAPVSVDLEALEIVLPEGAPIPFTVDTHGRRALLRGLDEIGMILAEDAADIAAYESRHRRAQPWLDLGDGRLTALGTERERAAG